VAQKLSKVGLQICSGLASGIDNKEHEGGVGQRKENDRSYRHSN